MTELVPTDLPMEADHAFYLEPPIQPGEYELALSQLRLRRQSDKIKQLSPEQVVYHYRWAKA